MAAVYHTVNIYPYPLTNLTVSYTHTKLNVVDAGDHYTVEVGDGSEFTISCDEYVDKTFYGGTYDIYMGNLYAWKIESGYSVTPSSATTFYTSTPTPSYDASTGSTKPIIYNRDGIAYNIATWVLKDNQTEISMRDTYITQANSSLISLVATSPV